MCYFYGKHKLTNFIFIKGWELFIIKILQPLEMFCLFENSYRKGLLVELLFFYVPRHEHANEIHSKWKAAMFRIHVGVRGEWKIKKAIFAPSYMFHNCTMTWKSEWVDKQPVCVCFKAFSFMFLYVFTLVCVTLIKISHLSFGFRSLTCCCIQP